MRHATILGLLIVLAAEEFVVIAWGKGAVLEVSASYVMEKDLFGTAKMLLLYGIVIGVMVMVLMNVFGVMEADGMNVVKNAIREE